MEELLKDLYKEECKRNHQLTIINSVLLVLCSLLLASCIFLSMYERVEVSTETYDQSIEGDDASIVNGNQYNDSAVHNQGSEMNGESEAEQD